MFLTGNIEKNNKFSPEDMLKNLQLCAENYGIEVDNIPSLQQIKSWISRFDQRHKKQAALKQCFYLQHNFLFNLKLNDSNKNLFILFVSFVSFVHLFICLFE